MSPRTARSAIVVGAGIAGLASAISLARAGWYVTVVERAPRPRGGAFVVGFSGIGFKAATRLGLRDQLRARASPWRPLQQVDGNGQVLAQLSESSQKTMSGRRMISILRGDLESVLHRAARNCADLHYGQTMAAVRSTGHGVTIVLEDGTEISADLLVGADGAHSVVRRLVFGPEARWRYDFGAEVVSYEITDPPPAIREKTTILTTIGRSAGLYPQSDGGLSAFFTFESHLADSGGPLTRLKHAYRDLGWLWPELINRAECADSVFFDDITQTRMNTWHHGRIVLVGDAAWAVSLLAGAGSSLAVGGALSLAEHLNRQPDISVGLDRWQRHMRPHVASKQVLGRRAKHLFLPSSQAAVSLRVAGIRTANSLFGSHA
ncbi:FAD-dependent oxidoreductase [Brevibacterium marinum]|nr:FAD-dependent oxidoreductase [Brevibacterium marinum]